MAQGVVWTGEGTYAERGGRSRSVLDIAAGASALLNDLKALQWFQIPRRPLHFQTATSCLVAWKEEQKSRVAGTWSFAAI
ncbi:hypothetical protein DOTSEDRAFT_73279 [Dothistroma septosporum NZE10]|uniref:Uncharacterized protein n=1 Tax=Dothistroma septosporum (strain NZE10 / CBS 128990) TaxID=675120 RepID=N1PJ27_DOTSN|nr:hypothetical protein DOTSEDRAFT_73279 [Dothistroma septosporum NZE10]